jgi:hypothetical protein
VGGQGISSLEKIRCTIFSDSGSPPAAENAFFAGPRRQPARSRSYARAAGCTDFSQ